MKLEETEEIKEEWEKMMESKSKIDAIMDGMSMEGMEEIKIEWGKLGESMSKIQDLMMTKMQ